MISQIFRFVSRHLGRRIATQVTTQGVQTMSGGLIDIKLGLRLLRDSRVPIKNKMSAMALGLAAVFVLEILELPVQVAMSLLLPVLGIAADLAFDGMELLAGPLLVASLVLPWLAPRDIVEKIRAESEGRVYQPVSAQVR